MEVFANDHHGVIGRMQGNQRRGDELTGAIVLILDGLSRPERRKKQG